VKRFFVIVSSVLVLAAPAAAAPPVGRPFRALEGESFGVSYFLTAFKGPGIFRGDCHYLVLEAGDWGAAGCASVSRDLAGYGQVCASPGRFLYGLTPRSAVLVRGLTTGGRTVPGPLQALPGPWRSRASAWILPVRQGVALRSIEALDRHRHVIASHVFGAGALRCAPVASRAGGRLPGHVRWTFRVRESRGAGGFTNVCEATTTVRPLGALTVETAEGQCTPVSLVGRGLLFGASGTRNCSPNFSIFTGLLSRRVSGVVVVLRHGRLRARVLAARATPFGAFVAAIGRRGSDVTYLVRTRDGHTHRVVVPSGSAGCLTGPAGNVGLPAMLASR
jgi:hypothetical protein